LNRIRHDSAEELRRQIHQIARTVFTDEPETAGLEADLKKLFVRILEKEDWTDKLASGLGKIRNKITRPPIRAHSSKGPPAATNRPHRDAKPLKETRAKTSGPYWETNLPEELRILVPDMREVEKAYEEMTNGYKEFIRDVVKASKLRRARRVETSPIDDSSDLDLRMHEAPARFLTDQT